MLSQCFNQILDKCPHQLTLGALGRRSRGHQHGARTSASIKMRKYHMLTRCRSDHSECGTSCTLWTPVWRRVRCDRWSGNINSIWSHDDKLNVLVNGRINWTLCYCQHCPQHPHFSFLFVLIF